MANPLKILTVLTASQAAKFEQGLNVNGQKVTGVADATVSTDAVAYGQLTSVSGAIKSYVDAQDTALSGAFDTRLIALSGAASSSLAAEKFAREQGDTQLTSLINSISQSVVADYIARDSALSTSLSSYVDARDLAVSSSLKAYVDAQNIADAAAWAAADALVAATASANLNAVSGALKTYIDVQDSALSSSLKSYVDAQDSAVSGALSGALAAETSARAAEDLTFLKLDGTRAMTAALNMGGFDISSAKSGSFSGDVTVGGNLQVNGALTYVNTTNLDVTDKLITLAKGSNEAAADGGGIEIDGTVAANTVDEKVSFTYSSNHGGWYANASIDVSASEGYLIGGFGALSLNAGGDLNVGSGFAGVTMEPAGPVRLAAETRLSSSTDFSYIVAVTRDVNNEYDVNAAIHALDVAVSASTNAGGTFKADYNARRHVATGTLSSGQVILNLTTLGGAQFAAAKIANIALDVMVDADSTGYTNDLVAIKMFVDGSDVKVQVDAPATPSAAYRLIAVNEEDIA